MPAKTELHARFCRNVRQRRRELKLTQQGLADLLGVSQPAVAAMESGRWVPKLDTIAEVAEALRITPESLLLLSTAATQDFSAAAS